MSANPAPVLAAILIPPPAPTAVLTAAPTHGRTNPYTPTHQNANMAASSHYANERGNPPAGIDADVWNRFFNRANSIFWQARPKATRVADTAAARADGRIRD